MLDGLLRQTEKLWTMMTEMMGTDILYAARILQQGGLVAMPTETVYGLAGNAFDERAAARIFAAKQRPEFDPLIVHLAEQESLPEIVESIPHSYWPLMQAFWPGPLTLIFPKVEKIPHLVTSGLGTVAVRVPAHPIARELIRQAGLPLAAPSANLFGRTSPTTAAHVYDQLHDRIDYILDAGPCDVGVESTIVREFDGELRILRPGGITREQILEVSDIPVEIQNSISEDKPAEAPGQLKEHYAPRTPLKIVEGPMNVPADLRCGFIQFFSEDETVLAEFSQVVRLTEKEDLVEAAARFFAALHQLDRLDLDLIMVRPFPEQGLGLALNDRLQRAAHRSR